MFCDNEILCIYMYFVFQGLIRHYRPELEARMKKFNDQHAQQA